MTIVTRDYLAYARALMRGCARHDPDADRFVVLVDSLPAGVVADVPGAEIIAGSSLGIDRWCRYSFQYRPVELSCALKAHAIDHLLIRRGYREIAYLDGDMSLYGPLTPVWQALEEHSVILTPHLSRPLPEMGGRPHETLYARAGTFNGGFLCVRNTAVGRSFIRWWQAMLRKECVVDQAEGTFVDQRWLCLVPGLFPEVCVLRNPGVNAGHWTLLQSSWEGRSTSTASTSDVHVDGHPLLLFHFSCMMPDQPEAYRVFQDRISVDDIPCLKRLVDDFHRDVRSAGLAESAAWGCGLARLSDGTPIKHEWREAIRREEPEFADVDDPFDVSAHADLKARYRAVEAIAHTWRSDWQVAWERERRVSRRLRKAWRRVRDAAGAPARLWGGGG